MIETTSSHRLWEKIEPIYGAIAAHPFNVELSQGTLSQERFEFYIIQDVTYLETLAEVLALLSQRAPSSKMRKQLKTFSKDAQAAADDLEKMFKKKNTEIAPSPACREYRDYLIAQATTAPFEESIASILPCFWIYRELGAQMAAMAKKGNPYSHWITLNSSQEYSEMTDKLIGLVDEISEKCSEVIFGLMESACECASIFEWRFWDDAYHMTKS